jgi:hypothetical protein
MEELPIFDPTMPADVEEISLAPRPRTLEGLCIGLVDNTKHNSDKLLVKIAALLERDHGSGGHLMRSKRSASVPVHEEVLEDMARACQAVVAGIGD